MMSKTDQPRPQKKSLLITINYNFKKNDISNYLISCCVEHYGLHLEDKNISPQIKESTFLFENVKFGEDFFKVFENTKLKIEKIEC